MKYGHCERGHFHGNEDCDECPWCNHPDEAYETLGDPGNEEE